MSSFEIIIKWLKDRSSVGYKELVTAVLSVINALIPYLPEKRNEFDEKSLMSDEDLVVELEKLKNDVSEKGILPAFWVLSLVLKLLSILR